MCGSDGGSPDATPNLLHPPRLSSTCTHTSPNLHTHKSTPSIPTRSHMAGRRCLPTSACVCVCMAVGPQMKKLLKSTKFPPHFDRKVDMRKVFLSHSPIFPVSHTASFLYMAVFLRQVKLEVMMPWITQQVEKHLGFQDEVVVGYVEVCVCVCVCVLVSAG